MNVSIKWKKLLASNTHLNYLSDDEILNLYEDCLNYSKATLDKSLERRLKMWYDYYVNDVSYKKLEDKYKVSSTYIRTEVNKVSQRHLRAAIIRLKAAENEAKSKLRDKIIIEIIKTNIKQILPYQILDKKEINNIDSYHKYYMLIDEETLIGFNIDLNTQIKEFKIDNNKENNENNEITKIINVLETIIVTTLNTLNNSNVAVKGLI